MSEANPWCPCLQVWSLPSLDSLGGESAPSVLTQIRVVQSNAEPIRSIKYVGGKRESLLVFGGQKEEEPDGLTLLQLPRNQVDELIYRHMSIADDQKILNVPCMPSDSLHLPEP